MRLSLLVFSFQWRDWRGEGDCGLETGEEVPREQWIKTQDFKTQEKRKRLSAEHGDARRE
jgi:hypothetical protein